MREEELRKQFQATHSDVIPLSTVEMTKERVVEAMDKLAQTVRQVDPTVYKYS